MHQIRMKSGLTLAMLVLGGLGGQVVDGYENVTVTGHGTIVGSEEAVCGAYNGTVCAKYVNGPVVLFPGRQTMEELEADLVEQVKTASEYGTPDCIAQTIAQTCSTLLRPCIEVEEEGTTYAIGAYTCQQNCRDTWDACRGIWEIAIMMNLGDLIPGCDDTPRYRSGNGEVTVIGENLNTAARYFTRGEFGQPIYPPETGIWVSPNGNEYSYPCNDFSQNVTFGVTLGKSCFEGLTVLDEQSNTCMVPCPHPLFSEAEYGLMHKFYVVPTLLGSAACMVVFFDSLYILLVKNSVTKEARKLPVFIYALLGSMVGFVYFLFGALPVVTTNLVCGEENVLPSVLDFSIEVKETYLCVINRGTIYLVMILFNIILLHLWQVRQRMSGVLSGGMMVSNESLQALQRGERIGFAMAFGVPSLLCALMYVMDDLNPGAANFQGQLARWSFVCGPRLAAVQEAFLVHVPFLVTGLGILYQVFQSRTLVGVITKELHNSFLGGSSTENVVTKGIVGKLKNLAKKLSILGVFCTTLIVMLTCATVLVIPKIDQSSVEYMDYLLCKTIKTISSSILKSVDSCEELYNRIGGDSVKLADASFRDKPPALLISFTFLAQSGVVCAFGFFYLSFVVQRHMRNYQRKNHGSSIHKSKVYAKSSNNSSSAPPENVLSTASKK